jgi:hypothetical protein
MNAGSTAPDNGAGTPAQTPAPDPGGPAILDGALRGFRDMLAADGYELNWSLTGQDKVQVQIVAGQDACADCLVPLPVIEGIMSDALAPTPYTLDSVVLPADA